MKHQNIQQLSLWNDSARASIEVSHRKVQPKQDEQKPTRNRRHHKKFMFVHLYKLLLPVFKQVWAISLLFLAYKVLNLPPDLYQFFLHK